MTDFHNGHVDVFDSDFTKMTLGPDAFDDPSIPAGYAPFGIRAIYGMVIVTYAKQDEDAEDDVKGAGFGFVDAFDLDGKFMIRVASHGSLNAPWGIVMAPDGFGSFGGDLLIGNFGDGRIHAFDLSSCTATGCASRGALRDEDGETITIDGLWALDFGKGNTQTGETNSLYFTAGPNDEADGLFGYLEQEEE